ncbi:MAG: FAD-dependent oxidoreductase [Clostridiales bacterium]|nr:FAD-dependent oxidoreductase [Clostridiales bacterium]
MASYWEEHLLRTEYPLLGEVTEADVCVIGGGITGMCIAFELSRLGKQVVLLEAERVGSGATSGTTAKVTVQHGGDCYTRLIGRRGEHHGVRYAAHALWALQRYEELAKEYGLDFDYTRMPLYLYCNTEEGKGKLMEEKHAHERLGIQSQLVDPSALPFAARAALMLPLQGSLHPLKLVLGLARVLQEGGGRIYEHSRVLKVGEDGVVTTAHGAVRAKQVVLATHYPIEDFGGRYFLKMYQERSYALGILAPSLLDAMYLGMEQDSVAYRPMGEFAAASGESHETGKDPKGKPYPRLHQRVQQQLGEIKVYGCWNAQDCMTYDGVPLIGRYQKGDEVRFVATGFGKWGMTHALTAAKIIGELVVTGNCKDESLYAPYRFSVMDLSRGYRRHLGTTIASVTAGWMGLPSINKGGSVPGGRIRRRGGKRMGIYTTEFGEEIAVHAKCTHMGCGLKWNDVDKTWDCPCHGSRFDRFGNVLEAPATRGLGEEDKA